MDKYLKKDTRSTTGPRMDTIHDRLFQAVLQTLYRCSHSLENKLFHKDMSSLYHLPSYLLTFAPTFDLATLRLEPQSNSNILSSTS